jgi:anti-sigma regulatory factor (Ser/Thr protein kinase)
MTDHGRVPSGAVAPVEVRAPALAEQLAGLRRTIRNYVESAGGDPVTADDLELVVSELATNVIVHTTSPTISVTIERTSEEWLIEVADVGDGFVLSDVPTLPPTFERAGRGLFVVRSLVDAVEIVVTATSRVIRCRRRATD